MIKKIYKNKKNFRNGTKGNNLDILNIEIIKVLFNLKILLKKLRYLDNNQGIR